MNQIPSGKERQVRALGGVAIDGAPIAYMVTLAAVVTVLASVPLSVIIGSGKSFPMSQAIYPLVGWILGPIAGAIAAGIGALFGVFLFPHTTLVPAATLAGAVTGGFTAGILSAQGYRKMWRSWISIFFVLIYAAYIGRAVLVNGANLWIMLLASFVNWSALLLFILPTRKLCQTWLESPDLKRTALGLFLGTWIIAGFAHLTASTIAYFVTNWPNEVWLGMAPVAPWEHLTRTIVGTAIGTGVIAGLRAIGLVKPRHAAY